MYILNSCANHVTLLLEFAKFSLLKFSQQFANIYTNAWQHNRKEWYDGGGRRGREMYNNNNKE
jgi:hypothetical protein